MPLTDSLIKQAKGFLSQVTDEANKYTSSHSSNQPPQGYQSCPQNGSYQYQAGTPGPGNGQNFPAQNAPMPPPPGQYYQNQPYQQGTPPGNQHPPFAYGSPHGGYQSPPPGSGYTQQPQFPGPPQQASPPAFAQGPPPTPQIPQSLKFKESAHRVWSLADLNSNRAYYTFHFSSSMSTKATTQVTRGLDGPECASVHFHTMTSSSADLTIGGRQIRVKKQLQSTTGLGGLEWKKDRKSFFSSKGNLLLYDQQGLLATFELDKGPDSYLRQSGNIQIHRQGLNQSQLDEIFISGVVELERNRIIAEAVKVVSVAT